MFLLASFAKIPISLGPLGWLKAQMYRLRRAPLTAYFGSPIDIAARTFWAVTTTATLLYITAGAVLRLDSISSFPFQLFVFVEFTLSLVWTLAVGVAARWYDPKETLKIGEAVIAEVDDDIRRASNEFDKRIHAFAALTESALRSIAEGRERFRAVTGQGRADDTD
jgi:hypothetical protein